MNLYRFENLSTIYNRYNKATVLKFGDLVIENITVSGGLGVRIAKIQTNFKKIISVSLTPYINYGQQTNSSQTVHDTESYIITNKLLRFYCNGNQTVDVSVVGLI